MSIKFSLVETRIIQLLKSELENCRVELKLFKEKKDHKKDPKIKVKSALEKELEKTIAQKNTMYDLLEKGVYTIDVFMQRMKNIDDKIQKLKIEIEKIVIVDGQAKINSLEEFSNQLDYVIKNYYGCSPKDKNMLLKSVIDKVIYYRPKGSRPGEFELTIYTKI